jgi:hypothetical protein
MGERLLDANRTIGQPKKLNIIFGRKITKYYKGKLQTVIEDMDLPSPVIRSHYGNGFAKQYVRDRANLRTEAATNSVRDYRVNKAIDNLPLLRQKQSAILDRYLDVQQDILTSFIDRGQFRQLSQPTVLANGKRVPGLKLDQPSADVRDACLGSFFSYRRPRFLFYQGNPCRHRGGFGTHHRRLHAGILALRSFQASR